jgi:hypothetical protein
MYRYANTRVLESLQLYQIIWKDYGPGDGSTDAQHRTGKCGEVMAAHLYYSIYSTPLSKQGARIGTVLSQSGTIAPYPPCGDPERVSETTLHRLSRQG